MSRADRHRADRRAALVRPTLSLAPVLAAIHASAFPPDEVWDEGAIALLTDSPGGIAWFDPRGGFCLARVAADEAEILTLAVRPERRREGIATRLLAAAMAAAAAHGARRILLEVAETNLAARMLYAAAGFRPVGRRVGYYASGEDALVLEALLALPPDGLPPDGLPVGPAA